MKKLPLLSIFLLALSVIVSVTSCEKDEIDKLPSETMNGQNTFGCLINGELFIPEKQSWTDVPLSGFFIMDENTFNFQAFNKKYIIGIRVWDPKPNSIYKFERNSFQELNKSNLLTGCGYVDKVFLDTTATNILTFSKFDWENQIASGTFNLEFMGDNCSEGNYKITEGRFDIKFSIY